MTAALSAFYPWVQLDCPGVPLPVMDDAIRRGAREFCKLSYAIQSDITIAMVVSTRDYAPTLSSGTEVITLLSLKRSATEFLTAKSQDYIDGLAANTGSPSVYCILETDPLSVRVFPTPTAIENLTAKFVLMPTQTATTVDSRLFDWYLEGVVAYAKYWLMKQQNKPWSNTDEAEFSYHLFETKIADTKVRRAQWHADLPLVVEMRPFA